MCLVGGLSQSQQIAARPLLSWPVIDAGCVDAQVEPRSGRLRPRLFCPALFPMPVRATSGAVAHGFLQLRGWVQW